MNRFLTGFLIVLIVLSIKTASFSQDGVSVYSTLEKHQRITLQEDYSYLLDIRQNTMITDSKGLDHGSYSINIDQFTKIENFEARIIDPKTGKTIRRIRTKDLNDRYSASIFVPEGYELDDYPENVSLTIPDGTLSFSYQTIAMSNNVQVNVQVAIKDNFVIADNYPNLKYFMEILTSKLKEPLILKKTTINTIAEEVQP